MNTNLSYFNSIKSFDDIPFEIPYSRQIYDFIAANEIRILDVRSESEFRKSHFPNSINIPILNDEDRHLVGIEYKENGNEAAIALGYRLVSGNKKAKILSAWKNVIEANEPVILVCMRGGDRSKIAKCWIREELNHEIKRLQNGYKSLRNFAISTLARQDLPMLPIVLNGNTGSGKTEFLKSIEYSIDLEGLALHRGSVFGPYIEEQPSQACFENALACEVIKLENRGANYVLLECESKGIGRVNIPNTFFEYMHSGIDVFLTCPINERVEFTYNSYIIDDIAAHIEKYGEVEGLHIWADAIRFRMSKLKKKLGNSGVEYVLSLFENALNTGDLPLHKIWIKFLLENYYDPLYTKSIEKSKPEYRFSAPATELLKYLNDLKSENSLKT